FVVEDFMTQVQGGRNMQRRGAKAYKCLDSRFSKHYQFHWEMVGGEYGIRCQLQDRILAVRVPRVELEDRLYGVAPKVVEASPNKSIERRSGQAVVRVRNCDDPASGAKSWRTIEFTEAVEMRRTQVPRKGPDGS